MGIFVVIIALSLVGIVVSIRTMRDLEAVSLAVGLVSTLVCAVMLLAGIVGFLWWAS